MIERVAYLAMHTSPLLQPGVGDAGGMNVYVHELACTMADRGIDAVVFTRRTDSKSVRSRSMAGPDRRIPAAVTTASSGPNRSTATSTERAVSGSERTSRATAAARPRREAVRSAAAASTSAHTTPNSLDDKASAHAAPIPDPAPVMRAAGTSR